MIHLQLLLCVNVLDVLHPPVDPGRLAVGQTGFVPCTPLGCMMLLAYRLGDLSGLEAVVIGRSNIFGKPMAQLLLDANATVIHQQDAELISFPTRNRAFGADDIQTLGRVAVRSTQINTTIGS